jgi:hypothetical protein
MDQSEKRAKAEQEYASLAIKVEERDALPVRAIPYVTGWSISPDVVANSFAREAAPFEKLKNTDTYHLVDDRPVKLLPKEWDRYVANLRGLEAELREKFANDDQGYAAWVSQSVAKLPAGVFVWLDEFIADFELDYGPERLSITQERKGDRELNLSPFLDDRALNMALEGFERRTPLRTHSSGDDYSGLVEYIHNGHVIDWRYWVENMPTLSPGEACRLLAGLDPELFQDLNSRPVPKNNPSQACSEAKRMERLAVAEKRERQTPDEWYRWALERSFCVHHGFFMAAYGRHLRENEAVVLGNMPHPEAMRWKHAQVIGDGQRQVSMDYSRCIDDSSMTFPDFVSEVEERLARWRRGRYELVEAAQVVADSAGMNGKQLAEQMDAAIRAGKLTYRVNNIRVDPKHIPQEHLWRRIVFRDDVNAWLTSEAIGGDLRLEYPYPNVSATISTSEPCRLTSIENNQEDERVRPQLEQDRAERDAFEKARADEQAVTGWYYLFEVAECITRQRGRNEAYSERLLKSIIDAAEHGLLNVFDEVHQSKLAKGEAIHSRRMTRREHVNAWLSADGAGYQWADESQADMGILEQSPPNTYGMSDGQLRECVQAIISRIKFLESFWRGRNAPAAEAAGLVSAGHAIHKLAIQYLKPYDRWPGREHESYPQEVTDNWALKWYFNYQTAMRDHIRGLQEAVRKGELTLRTLNRAKVPDDVVQSWCNSDPWPKATTNLRMFPDCAKWDVMASDWPDNLGLPSGGFDRSEWTGWAVGSGLVELDLAGTIAIKAIAANSHTEATQEGEQATQQKSEQLDYNRLATPTILAEAFGPLTGMNTSWFADLRKGHPLREARKADGRAGRRSVEPLFDIIEVAQWLADQKPRFQTYRRIGKRVIWNIVQRSFPKAYALADLPLDE